MNVEWDGIKIGDEGWYEEKYENEKSRVEGLVVC